MPETTTTVTTTVPAVEVVEPIRRSVVVLVVRIFLLLFIADTLYAFLLLGVVLGIVPSGWSASYTLFLWVAHTLKNIMLTYLLLYMVVGWISSVYYVTAGHLIRQRGVLKIEETVFQLTDIEAVGMNQSWLGRLFNFGDVTIRFSIAREPRDIMLYAINNPRKYESLFSKYV
ncbi:MAG: PH domain-containing protein [bacterium]